MQAEAGAPLSADQKPDSPADEEQDSSSAVLTAPDARPGVSWPMVALLAGIALTAYALDQGTKAWAVSSLETGVPQDFIGSFLKLRRTSNPGAAFSLATNATWVLTIVACLVILATLFIARKLRSKVWACALGLLIGGALGNLTDRFFREPGGGHGHVVDFLELPNWPIFNVADMSIVSAAVLICIVAFVGIGVDGSRISDDDDDDDDVDDSTAEDAAGDEASDPEATTDQNNDKGTPVTEPATKVVDDQPSTGSTASGATKAPSTSEPESTSS